MTKRLNTSFWRHPLQWIGKHNWHKHPFVIPVAALFLLLFTMLGLFVFVGREKVLATDSHLVVFSYDKKQETVPTRAKNVGEFLERVGVTLNEGDVVEPAKDTEILDEKFRINVYRARPVVVVDGNRKTFAFSAATTPRSVASQVGIEVYPEDKLDSKMETDFVRDGTIGEKVIINRATPTNLNLYGTPIPIRTHAKTVGELLKEKKIELASDDSVQPSADTAITPQLQIFVARSGTQIVTVEEAIPMEVETVQDASLSFGASAIRQRGAPGKRVVTYQVELTNGKETGRKEIQSIVAQEPVKQIVARGKAFDINKDKAAVMSAAGISRDDYPYVDYIVSRESGWRVSATNGRTWGLCQALPGSKMASAGADWQTNPVTQLKWCSGYAIGRYGTWAAAYNFWVTHHWW